MNEYAEEKVNGPGIALLVVGILGILGNLAYSAYTLITALILPLTQGADISMIISSSISMVATGGVFLLSVLGSILIAVAGSRLRSLRSPGLVYAGAILACLPMCGSGVCCCLGLPVGIWVIVTMQDEQVKAAFTE